jgi:hypothetical protein
VCSLCCAAGRSVRYRHAAQLPPEDQPQPPYTPTRPQARARTQAPNSPQARARAVRFIQRVPATDHLLLPQVRTASWDVEGASGPAHQLPVYPVVESSVIKCEKSHRDHWLCTCGPVICRWQAWLVMARKAVLPCAACTVAPNMSRASVNIS